MMGENGNCCSFGEENAFYRYIRRILVFALTISVVIIFFNWFINPYGVWLSSRIHGVNEAINLEGHERLYKMIRVSREDKLEVLLLGSSTVFKVLSPSTYSELTGKRVYNGGLSGASVLEMKYMLEQAIYFHPELTEVILGLNWFMFHEEYEGIAKEFPENQVGWKFPFGEKCVVILFSMDAIRDSMQTLKRSSEDNWHMFIDEDGRLNEYYVQTGYAYSKNLDQFAMDTVSQLSIFRNYRLSKRSMEAYESILEMCRLHGIRLTVYINPVHSIFLESIYTSGGGANFEEWKRTLATLYPVYDFAHYSLIGNEPFSLQRRYWRNTQHEMPVTGDLIFARIAESDLPGDVGEFGILLTKYNVEEILKFERRDRERWRSDNPDIVKFVEGLVARY